MTLFIGACIVTLEGICSYLHFRSFFAPRKQSWYWPVLYVLFSNVLSMVLMALFEGTFFKFLIAVCLWSLLSCLFFRGMGMERFFASAMFFLLRYGLSYSVIFALEFAKMVEIPDILNTFPRMPTNPTWMLLAGVVSRSFLLLCVLVGRHILREKSAPYHYGWWEWAYIFLFPLTAFCIYVVFFNDIYILSRGQGVYMIIAWGLILTSLLELYLIERGVKNRQMRRDHLIISQRNAIERESIAAVTQAFVQQRQMTHDFQNHLQLIEQLLAAGETARGRAYIESLLETASANSLPVHTGHSVLDALLNYKYVTARRHGIPMEIIACPCAEIPLRDDDLVIILSNAIDNAIEACQKLDGNRLVRIKIAEGKTEWILSVMNTAPRPGPNLPTSKRDPLLHGYGLCNIRQALARYDHDIAISHDNGWFQLTAAIRTGSEEPQQK